MKGGGHRIRAARTRRIRSLIWTRRLHDVRLHDAFVAAGCEGQAPQPAVSVGPGAIWGHVYNEVTTKGGRYVQGGGCLTVGVAGLVLGGGFGSFSKAHGMAGAQSRRGGDRHCGWRSPDRQRLLEPRSLLGAQRGRRRFRRHDPPHVANARASRIRRGGVRGRQGGVGGRLSSLVGRTSTFTAMRSSIRIGESRSSFCRVASSISMLFHGLDRERREATWRPFFDWVAASPQDYVVSAPKVLARPARHFWDPALLRRRRVW